jgi:hypothetical protein
MANEVGRILRIIMRFEDIMVLTTKNAAWRGITRSGRDVPTLRRHLFPSSPEHPEDGSNVFLRNVKFLPEYTALHFKGKYAQSKVQYLLETGSCRLWNDKQLQGIIAIMAVSVHDMKT